MKDFIFSLQSLLDAKEALQKLAEMRLGAALKKSGLMKKGLERLHKLMRNEVLRVEKDAAPKGEGSSDFAMHFMYMNRLRSMCDKQVEIISVCDMEIVELRNHLVLVMKDKEAFVRLSENEYQQWKLEQRRIERGEMDAIAMESFLRKRKIA